MDFASTNVYMDGLKSFRIEGEKDKDKSISQEVVVSGNESDLYVISGWAKAYSVPEFNKSNPVNIDRRFKISIKVTYTDGYSVWKSPIVFNQDIVNWQYGAMTLDLSDDDKDIDIVRTPSKITIYPRYDYQGNYAYFDNLSITKDNVANYNTYSYDTNGNMELKTKNTSQSNSMRYDNELNKYELTSVSDAKNEKTYYEYDTENKHNLTQAVTRDGVVSKFVYDNSGNVVQSVIQNSVDDITPTPTPSLKIQTDTSYTTDGAYISTTSDQDNNVTSYSYDQNKGLLTSVTNSNGNTTNYTYQANTDTKTGLFYVGSRYYNPEWGRFINADSTDVLTSSTDVPNWDKNLFVYCDNNPITRADDGGDCWFLIAAGVGALIGGVASAISQQVTTGHIDWGVVGVDTLSGAASGLLASTGVGIVGAIAGNAAISGATYLGEQAVQGNKSRWDEFLYSSAFGGLAGGIGGSGINTSKMQGIWNTSKSVLKRAASPKKIAMYTAKKTIIKSTAKVATTRAVIGAATVSVASIYRKPALHSLGR